MIVVYGVLMISELVDFSRWVRHMQVVLWVGHWVGGVLVIRVGGVLVIRVGGTLGGWSTRDQGGWDTGWVEYW